jgi:hypothetical protein
MNEGAADQDSEAPQGLGRTRQDYRDLRCSARAASGESARTDKTGTQVTANHRDDFADRTQLSFKRRDADGFVRRYFQQVFGGQ